MSRLRRYLIPTLLLLPLIFICGKLLLTPVLREASIFESDELPRIDIGTIDMHEIGWPWVFSQSYETFTPENLHGNYFSLWILIADTVLMLGVILAIAKILVLHRKHHGSWLRFSIRELLIATAFVAISCSWLTLKIRQCSSEQHIIDEEWPRSDYFAVGPFGSTYCGPGWLQRLLPYSDYYDFLLYRTTGIQTWWDLPKDEVNNLCIALRQMPYVRVLRIGGISETDGKTERMRGKYIPFRVDKSKNGKASTQPKYF